MFKRLFGLGRHRNPEQTDSRPSANNSFEFDPHSIVDDAIDEAINHLGLLERAAKPKIASMIGDCRTLGFKAVAAEYRKSGDQLSTSEKKALGLRPNSFMSQQAASDLTEKGKTKPLEAHFLTLWRADFTIDRANQILAASKHEHCRLKYVGQHRDGCAHCDVLGGKQVSPFDVTPFPPKACPNDACCMSLRLNIDYAAMR